MRHVSALANLISLSAFWVDAAIHDLGVTVAGPDFLPTELIRQYVRVDGCYARVIVDALIRHTGDGQAEGTFCIELPTEASPFLVAFGLENEGEKLKADLGRIFFPMWSTRS